MDAVQERERGRVIYPIYLNSLLPLKGGRKFSASLSVPNPTKAEIAASLARAGYVFKEEDKQHPKWTLVAAYSTKRPGGAAAISEVEKTFREGRGRFFVQTSDSRREVVKRVSEEIKASRTAPPPPPEKKLSQKAAASTEGRVENKLGLTAKKKSKKKNRNAF